MSIINEALANPDIAALVSVGVGYVSRLLWKKAKAVTEGELWDTMLKVAYQAFPGLFRDARLYDDAHVREVISRTIWAGLTRLNVKKTDAVMKLVDDVVEHAVGELAYMVMQHHLGNVIKPLERAAAKLEAAPPEKAIDTTEPATASPR